jgi:hypothetical protein
MQIPDFYVPVTFAGQQADDDGCVVFEAVTPTFRRLKIVGVNVKTTPSYVGETHTADITVKSSKVESNRLRESGVSLRDLAAFESGNVGESGSASIKYQDPSDCVRPIDVGCTQPRLPVRLTNPVSGSLFQVEMTISGYEHRAVVNAAVALCYEPGQNAGNEG